MTGGQGKQPRAAEHEPEPGTVEQRVNRWAAMLDEAVGLLDQVMTEIRETGRQNDDDRRAGPTP